MTRSQLADKCAVTLRTIQRWEGADQVPGLRDATKLAKALRVPLRALAGRLLK